MKSVYIREGENRDVDKDPQWFPGVQDGELLPAVVRGQDQLLAVLLVTLVRAVRHQVTQVAQWDAGPVPAVYNWPSIVLTRKIPRKIFLLGRGGPGLNDSMICSGKLEFFLRKRENVRISRPTDLQVKSVLPPPRTLLMK